ncbi:MAG TPA: DUF6152 family protein [Gammaproteobacteria bacterium]|nr:DUF6152 family protein [Gammaproteobacteria bacterium]
MTRNLIALAAAALFVSVGAEAHHSFPVHFVSDKIVSVTGVVTEFRFRNPHGLVFFTVPGPSGDEAWKAETNSPNILRRRGWDEHSLTAGDRVTVTGYPSRDGDHYLRVYKITFEDGRELIGQRPTTGVADGKD